MGVVLAMLLAVWGVGVAMKAPGRLRWAMMGLVLVGVILINLTLPGGSGLRDATGGSALPWVLLLGGAALVGLYRLVLVTLRSLVEEREKAREDAVGAASSAAFSEVELDRYARHIVLREIGGPGQKALKNARVLVIGAGGLGSPALLYLAAAGVGTIGVIDADVVDNSNLQRQVLHRDADIGKAKVFSAQIAMEAQNPAIRVLPYNRRLTEEIAPELFAGFDLVLDGTDNFETRYLANQVAIAAGIPLISGALSQWEGQLSVFHPAQGGPCYRCIFPRAPGPGLAPSCAEAGVLGPLPGVVGSMMAVEAIKLICGAGAPLRGEMMIYDALWGETRKIALKRRENCPDCGHIHGAVGAGTANDTGAIT